jgi:conjugal transfer/entry exclusion protein
MKKTILTLISGALLISSVMAFASQEPVSGKSVLKLEDNPVRSARTAIAAIDKQIVQLDRQILDTKNQAAALKALPNDGLRSKQMEMLATSYEIQKADLKKERGSLEAVIHAE